MFLIWPNEGLIERLSETREFALEWATERSCFAKSKKNGHKMQTIVNNNLLLKGHARTYVHFHFESQSLKS